MAEGRPPRLLLILPTTTYRAGAFVEAAEALGIELTVASEEDSAFSEGETEGLLTLDYRDAGAVAETVKAFAARHPIDAVFGVDDDTAVAAAVAAATLGLPHNPVAAVEAGRDKHRQREVLQAAGVPVPRFALHRVDEDPVELAEEVEYPCVLKPLDLSASRGVIRANDPAEFVAAHSRLMTILDAPDVVEQGRERDRFLVEQFVPGPEVALEGLVVDGELCLLALFDKPDPLDGPYFEETIYATPSRAPRVVQEALVQCAAHAARALGIERGPVHAELRFNEDGPWLIELAARPIGGKCGQVLRFGDDGAVSLEQLVLGHALGVLKDVPPREAVAAGVMMVPIPQAGVLREVKGVDHARGACGVTDVVITVHPGQELRTLPEESRYLGFIFARGERPEVVVNALRIGHRRLEVAFD
jgi:biotin carboxylase